MKPKALTALHDAPINHRAVQNKAAAQTGVDRPFDATDVYAEVQFPNGSENVPKAACGTPSPPENTHTLLLNNVVNN